MSRVADLYLIPEGSQGKTFANDESLPNLPLPTLSSSLSKYLESVKPFTTDEEFEQTKALVEKFQKTEGQVLHKKLTEKAKRERNWVDKWWYEWAYLRVRSPLIPYCSMDGLIPADIPGWKYENQEDQILHGANFVRICLEFWNHLRNEKIQPSTAANKTPFSMAQFRKLYNTVRLPGEEIDILQSSFKTVSEGNCPSTLIVLHRGRIFSVDALSNTGALLTVPEIELIFRSIIKECEFHPAEYPVASLTCDERTSWAKNYKKLRNLSKKNSENLDLIERAIYYVALDDDEPKTDSEVGMCDLCGDYRNRWADKSSSTVLFKNGRIGGISDHTAYDGLVSITMMHFGHMNLLERKGQWDGTTDINYDNIKVNEIKFDLNDDLKSEINRFAVDCQKNKGEVSIVRKSFSGFGKLAIQKCKLHPDAFVQMALQLTYARIHGRPAPCYETATTRTYYNGRTETVRSCSIECLEWVTAMLAQSISRETKQNLLKKAVEKHNSLMNDCKQNEGCDRHLFGLYCTALEEGLPIPEIYSDPAYTKSGGGGNFILSTSLTGYTPINGGVAPMCLDGYGVFYSILPNCITVTITTNTKSNQTNGEKFFIKLGESFYDMLALWPENSSTSKL